MTSYTQLTQGQRYQIKVLLDMKCTQTGIAQQLGVNNYKSTKSFKDSMQHLENSSRKIADSHLHTRIRPKEVLPNKTQVNFSNDIDILLSEIVRLLK